MAWSASMMMSDTLVDIFNNDEAIDFGADTWKCALFDNTVTPTGDTAGAAYGSAPWDSGECTSSSSNWDAGGVALSSQAVTLVAGYGVMFDADDTTAANTTIATAAYGCIIYDTTTNSRVLVAVYFGGSGYTTNNGTFGITWDSNGICRIDVYP